MKLYQLPGVSINSEKYEKIVVDGYYSRSGWFPLKVEAKVDEKGSILLPNFKVIKTKEKGTIMLVPSEVSDNRVLVAGQVWGGFRGGASIVAEHTTANILWSTMSSKHCEGVVSVFAVLNPAEKIVFHEYGRRHDIYRVLENQEGSIVETRLEKEAFQGLISLDEEFEEV
jgi:hypothetical protein